jgi:glucose/arabinose dehydrogenase
MVSGDSPPRRPAAACRPRRGHRGKRDVRRAGSFGGLAAAALLLIVGVFATAPPPAARAQASVPDIGLETILQGLSNPTQVTHAGDFRLFIVLQRGRILIWDRQELQSTPFLDIQHLVSCCGERGLLSMAFHPQDRIGRFFFVNYTNVNGDTVIARYTVAPNNPNISDPDSGRILLTIPQPFTNHNGGQLMFGPDGYLYIGMGDGGSANDPNCTAQRDDTLLGKMLRIDVNANIDTPPFYGIPASNPFVGPALPLDEIWAKGLRNPWRFSFDRERGDLWIGDVGQGAREEIDFQAAGSGGGRNYGWKLMEGTACGGGGPGACPGNQPQCGDPVLIRPIYEYSHAQGDCSVTGGFVYRGSLHPELRGVYVYGDYCTGRLWGNTRLFTPRASGITSFGEDWVGELYLVTDQGLLARVVNPAPAATDTPSNSPTSTRTPTATVPPAPVGTSYPRATPAMTPGPPHVTPRVVVRPPEAG